MCVEKLKCSRFCISWILDAGSNFWWQSLCFILLFCEYPVFIFTIYLSMATIYTCAILDWNKFYLLYLLTWVGCHGAEATIPTLLWCCDGWLWACLCPLGWVYTLGLNILYMMNEIKFDWLIIHMTSHQCQCSFFVVDCWWPL